MKESDLGFKDMRIIVLHRDNYLCQICKDAEATEADHIWPRRVGGKDTLDNLQAACGPCNKAKGGTSYVKDITYERADWSFDHYVNASVANLRAAARWLCIADDFFEDISPDPHVIWERYAALVPDRTQRVVLELAASYLGLSEPADSEAYGYLVGMVGAA